MPMHGHGFALMFLASVYGMITKESLRQQVGDDDPQGGDADQPGPERRRGAGPTSPGPATKGR